MAKKKSIKDYTEVGSMSAELILKNLPFVLFLGLLAMTYIANAHYAEKKVRQIQEMQIELRELRWHYMSLKSELMYNSKQSEVLKDVEPIKLKSINGNPRKIVVFNN